MPLAITTTPCARPHYFAQTLSALAACQGIADCILMPSVDPWPRDPAAIKAMLSAFTACPVAPVFNTTTLGPDANTLAAIDRGFASGAEHVVHVEEDILLAPDALDYFRWAFETFSSDPGVFSVTAYNRLPALPEPAAWHATARRSWFHPWGVGLWRGRWEASRAVLASPGEPGVSWDTRLTGYVRAAGLAEIYPVLSRSQNIGVESSVHGELGAEWFEENHRLRWWAGGLGVAVPPGDFSPPLNSTPPRP